MKSMNMQFYISVAVIYFLLFMDYFILALVFAVTVAIFYLHTITKILMSDKNINVTFRKKGDQNE